MKHHKASTASSSRLERIAWLTLVAFCAPLFGGCYPHAAYIPPSELPKLNTASSSMSSEYYGAGENVIITESVIWVTTTEGTKEGIQGEIDASIVFKDGTEYDCPSYSEAAVNNGVLSIYSYGTTKSFPMRDIEHVDIHTFSWVGTGALVGLGVGALLALLLIPDWYGVIMD